MTIKATYELSSKMARIAASKHCMVAPDGTVVNFEDGKASNGQKARFHSICRDFEKAEHPFAGKPRTAEQWKILLISAHATATREEAEVVEGLEGELVNLRESTARMSRQRSASLISYAMAYAAEHKIPIRDPRDKDRF